MVFDLDGYIHILFIMPFMVVLFDCAFLVTGIVLIATKSRFIQFILGFKLKKFWRIFIMVAWLGGICFTIANKSISYLSIGVPLLSERKAQPQVTTGTVEKTQKLLHHRYRTEYKKNDDMSAYWITISGKKYYFMAKGNIRIGDNVEIAYLPKSKVVLEVKFMDLM